MVTSSRGLADWGTVLGLIAALALRAATPAACHFAVAARCLAVRILDQPVFDGVLQFGLSRTFGAFLVNVLDLFLFGLTRHDGPSICAISNLQART